MKIKSLSPSATTKRTAAISSCAWLLSATLCLSARAEIRLPKMLSSHAVLQRDQPLHIWGWSEPRECVAVTFHAQRSQACADEIGMWSTYLKPEGAGGPYTLAVEDARDHSARVTIDDLLVGDVWFASGQSNMEMPLKGFGPDTPVRDGEREIAAAKHPRIRLLRFSKAASPFPLDDQDATWTECTPATAADFSAVAYFFGRELATEEKVPIGLIDSTWGGTPIESWISLGGIAQDASLMPLFASRAKFTAGLAETKARIAAEKQEDADAARAGLPAPKHMWHPEESSYNPSYLYNAMIAPATPYTLRGFLWYQGETNSNPERAPLYKREMPALVADWRAQWGLGDLPFLYVQISSFDSPQENWGIVRDAQRTSLSVNKTAMAVSLDLGNPKNVHPAEKQEVGHRLALGARALSYDEKLEWSGPLVRSASWEAEGIRVWFDHAAGLGSKEPLRGFEVAGSDGIFKPAAARIDGGCVLVQAPASQYVKAVRYAWANVTDANLTNGAGLPASTFVVSSLGR